MSQSCHLVDGGRRCNAPGCQLEACHWHWTPPAHHTPPPQGARSAPLPSSRRSRWSGDRPPKSASGHGHHNLTLRLCTMSIVALRVPLQRKIRQPHGILAGNPSGQLPAGAGWQRRVERHCSTRSLGSACDGWWSGLPRPALSPACRANEASRPSPPGRC